MDGGGENKEEGEGKDKSCNTWPTLCALHCVAFGGGGKVTELTPEETEDTLGGYGKTVSHVVIGLKTRKGTKQLRLVSLLSVSAGCHVCGLCLPLAHARATAA